MLHLEVLFTNNTTEYVHLSSELKYRIPIANDISVHSYINLFGTQTRKLL